MIKNNVVAGYRVMLSKTQKDMAGYLDISPQSYNNKENGRRSFNDSEKKKIKELFSSQIKLMSYEELFF